MTGKTGRNCKNGRQGKNKRHGEYFRNVKSWKNGTNSRTDKNEIPLSRCPLSLRVYSNAFVRKVYYMVTEILGLKVNIVTIGLGGFEAGPW